MGERPSVRYMKMPKGKKYFQWKREIVHLFGNPKVARRHPPPTQQGSGGRGARLQSQNTCTDQPTLSLSRIRNRRGKPKAVDFCTLFQTTCREQRGKNYIHIPHFPKCQNRAWIHGSLVSDSDWYHKPTYNLSLHTTPPSQWGVVRREGEE